MAGAADRRWAAARRLFEGAPASVELLAAVCGLKVRSVREKARLHGWQARRGRERVHAPLRPLLDRLTSLAASIGSDDGGAGKTELAALPALLKTIQLLGEMTGGADERAERTKENDERLAAILRRIDDRIVELARAYADEIVRDGQGGRSTEQAAPDHQ